MTDASAAGTLALGDLTVNRLGFGAMQITGRGVWGPPPDHDTAIAVLRRAVELGVDFIDTADSYGPAVSEELIAEALSPYPDGLVIATKGGYLRDGPSQWRPDGRPEHLREACEGSLRRLGVERITLHQFHVPDPAVPFEESVGALVELQAEGKIQHIGLSNVTTEQVDVARELTPIVSVQNRYNVANRTSDPVIAHADELGYAFIPWTPVSSGNPSGSALSNVASNHGISLVQAAIAWQLARSPQMLPIPGTKSLAHLEENIAAAAITLTPEDLESLSTPPRPRNSLSSKLKRKLRG